MTQAPGAIASTWRRRFGRRSPAVQGSTTGNFETTSTPPSILARKIGTSGRKALIDTSVLAGLRTSDLGRLSPALATSALALAELARGPAAAAGDLEEMRRRNHLRQVEASVEALAFDLFCARAYASVCEAVERVGRTPRGSRAVDLMIAATALAHDLPLYTLNAKDLRGLESVLEVVDVSSWLSA